ncbi:hypothetical protein D9615_001377 [Tricholomella constricta]|uniref:Protein YOP1 n=1 Tax=Tricholomella constricta TaxID=117010 RepID=A0A8H5HKL4_9AGAR|nr:hypothetical protein D9615_001377 [Tricholomella constricta]
MFMSLLSHAVSAWFAFLLPCYATFKALSHRPLSEPDLQRWSMYWAVIGAFVAFEYLCEWLISWLPFYWEVKTLFLLFLALPQTEGSTYIYTAYLQPFFIKHETDLDAGIISVQRNIFALLQARLAALWEVVWSIINKAPVSGQSAPGQSPATGPAFSLQSAMSLWNTYSPLMNRGSQPARSAEPNASSTSVRTPTMGQRAAHATDEVNQPNSSDSAQSFNRAPAIPEPQHSKIN